MANTRNLSPSDILYNQKSISNKFRNGKTLDEVTEGILNGTISVKSIPMIRVVKRFNKWWSLGNMRLCVFKEVQRRVPNFGTIQVRQVKIDEKEWKRTFTTKNGGISIQIRGGQGQVMFELQSSRMLLDGTESYGGEDYDSEDDWDESDLQF